ncbi:hypothetical protein KR51_00034800 [Rubidibacter lacunae KORDI 51-2]|uniref:Uncharacterized protein n=1 Tax=Rubidibacter lacunae KORDI 51-2 TaxID=582515 RepID=U5D6C1_9CHRO|nr:hypothetical protein [Rubidibacter lacunae]ERN40188.1 hypothetical protein KR51_00034800 [Rubidibacter lacunae KORDI 51-2]
MNFVFALVGLLIGVGGTFFFLRLQSQEQLATSERERQQQLESAERNAEKRVRDATSNLRKDLQNLQRDREVLIRQTDARIQTALEEANKNRQEEIDVEVERIVREFQHRHQAQHHGELEALRSQYEEQFQLLHQKHDAEIQNAVAVGRADLEARIAELESYLQSSPSNKPTAGGEYAADVGTELDGQLQSLQAQHADALERVRADYEQRVSALEQQLAQATAAADGTQTFAPPLPVAESFKLANEPAVVEETVAELDSEWAELDSLLADDAASSEGELALHDLSIDLDAINPDDAGAQIESLFEMFPEDETDDASDSSSAEGRDPAAGEGADALPHNDNPFT